MFFGTPFQGAVPAKAALMYATIANDQNARLYTTLLDLLSEGNLALQELRSEFQNMSARMATKIQIRCVWEEGWTKFSQMMKAVEQRTEMPPRRKAILLKGLKERGLLEEEQEESEQSTEQNNGSIWEQVAKRLSFEVSQKLHPCIYPSVASTRNPNTQAGARCRQHAVCDEKVRTAR